MSMKEKIPCEVSVGANVVEWHYATGQVETLRLAADSSFGWIRGIFGMPYGMCYLDKRERLDRGIRHIYEYMSDLRLTVERTLDEEGYSERYVWRNVGKKPLDLAADELGVYATFAEKYDIADVCRRYRAYTHALVAGDVFYMYNARLNGDTAGVGLVLTEGVIDRLAEERLHPEERGDLVVMLPARTLAPDEEIVLSWRLFAYADREEFGRRIGQYAPLLQIDPICPEVGQSVRVTVDGVSPAEVRLNGIGVSNPFIAPKGEFVLQPMAEDDLCRLVLSGTPHVGVWAERYRGWGRGKYNPRRYVAESAAYTAAYEMTGDAGDLQRAADALRAYYHTPGAYRKPQAFLPVPLLRKDDALRARFERHLAVCLRPNRRRYTADRALAEYSMLCVAEALFAGRYAEAKEAAKADVQPLLDTPFGKLFVGDDLR